MGKLLPVDYTTVQGSTDIVCYFCHSPYGGLVYNEKYGKFIHRDAASCSALGATRREGLISS